VPVAGQLHDAASPCLMKRPSGHGPAANRNRPSSGDRRCARHRARLGDSGGRVCAHLTAWSECDQVSGFSRMWSVFSRGPHSPCLCRQTNDLAGGEESIAWDHHDWYVFGMPSARQSHDTSLPCQSEHPRRAACTRGRGQPRGLTVLLATRGAWNPGRAASGACVHEVAKVKSRRFKGP